MKKVLFIIGTRPEAIKLKPVIENINKFFQIKICLTNQHENIRNTFLEFDNSIIELKLKREENNLTGLMGNILLLLDNNTDIQTWKPDIIAVHGDTCSALCGAFYAFYSNIKLCHIEAGLRTHDKFSPFPEEANRKIIDYLSDIHFAPTEYNQNNLQQENIIDNVYVVGNSIIDVIKTSLCKNNGTQEPYGLVTLHRRENWDSAIESSLNEIVRFASDFKYKILYVCNYNSLLKNKIIKIIGNNKYVQILDPLNSTNFHELLKNCTFVVTDSGGIQEEAIYFSKPLLIMRTTTERQEIINHNCGYLINPNTVYAALTDTLGGSLQFNIKTDLYGDGSTSKKLTEKLYEYLLYKS